jgi:hypothetical protein
MVKVQDTHSNDLKLHPYHKDPDQYGSGAGVKSGFFSLQDTTQWGKEKTEEGLRRAEYIKVSQFNQRTV